eukprot:GFUD01014688.1.p1 GENE.GFUD01014688.1~~GFUD01014688.1.p1  ORF type:complete len:372 (-),score=63.94 GFUD01014688.1:424-1539(-)
MWSDITDTDKNNDFLSLFNKSKVAIDNPSFWLHRTATVVILVLSTVILTLNSYVGDPIHCVSASSDKPQFSDTYCWIYGTQTFSDGSSCTHNQGKVMCGEEDPDCSKTHEYYQWVALTLLVQAVCFYIPGWLWLHWEKGQIADVVGENGMKEIDVILVESKESIELSAKTVSDRIEAMKGSHKKWAAKFVLCEVANFGIAISQFYFTDIFLGGEFMEYGTGMLEYVTQPEVEGCHPMTRIFPILTNCLQNTKGGAGGDASLGFVCVLPANIWNQKFYLFFYFWLTFLILVGFFQFVYRILTILSRHFRNRFEKWDGKSGRCWTDYSDWLFNKFVLKNCNPVLREAIRRNVSENLTKSIITQNSGNSVCTVD